MQDPESDNDGDSEHGGNGEGNQDPRGFVYEAVTSNRLSGVVASVYRQDPVTGVPRLWNAAEYGQKNDQITSSNGVFAWDVPEGNWQVRCKLAGYENAQSEWLPVPPPQLDVMIPMVSYAVPVIVKSSVGNGFIDLEFSKYMMPESMKHLTLKDMQNQPVGFTLEYAVNETNETGVVLSKTYRLKVNKNDKNYMVGLDEKIQSYAGVGMEALEILV